jgi:effector-binding domain-containing protein
MYKFFLKILIFFTIGLILWFFFKDYNHKYSFTIDQSPRVVYDHLIRWKHSNDSLINQINIDKHEGRKLIQEINIGNYIYRYKWNLKQIDERETKVIVKVLDIKNRLNQNLNSLDQQSNFFIINNELIKDFGQSLLQNKKNYFLSDVEISSIPPLFSAYITLESSSEDKALVMRNNIHRVMYYLNDNNIDLLSAPFLEIMHWNLEKDSLKFNFSFPIVERNYQENNDVNFKKNLERKALKIIFNGNYKISDRAWLTLLDYAEYNRIDIEKTPIEIFLNDPQAGGDELDWEANVYLPLKN